jgi:hypothetical protein
LRRFVFQETRLRELVVRAREVTLTQRLPFRRWTTMRTVAARLVRTAIAAERLRGVAYSAVTAGSGQPLSVPRARSYGHASTLSLRPSPSVSLITGVFATGHPLAVLA